MRFFGVLILLLVVIVGAAAQDDDPCGATAINGQIDTLIADYEAARAENALGAAESLQESLSDLLVGCVTVQPGQWRIVWGGVNEQACPESETTVVSQDRDFVLLVDPVSGALGATDNQAWPTLQFERVGAGEYLFRRNEAPVDDAAATYEYRLFVESAEEIRGEGTLFVPGEDCGLLIAFTMTLVDENIICMVNSDVAANLRSGPGTQFERAGTIPLGDLQPVIGQAESSDGFTWWQLADSNWVRSDVVDEAGDCESVAVTG